ncbi:DUF4019 domain-containing protein [Ralstonia sp. 1138]|uniref:DUF4019 domain-containing protein n=1 Tax=Ralstonia sp. 1138 TaxID=3156423 RepID=UPI00339952EA
MNRFNGALKMIAACALATASVLAHGAEAGDSADELLGNATLALKRIDAGDYTTLWQQTAPFVRGIYTADRFAAGLVQARKSVGTVSQRGWASVTRLTYTKVKDVPDGLYANVDYATRLTDGRVIYEKVSFQLGADGHWYFTGYDPRQNQEGAAQAQK